MNIISCVYTITHPELCNIYYILLYLLLTRIIKLTHHTQWTCMSVMLYHKVSNTFYSNDATVYTAREFKIIKWSNSGGVTCNYLTMCKMAEVKTPPFTKGKNQLEKIEVDWSRLLLIYVPPLYLKNNNTLLL